MIETHTPIGNVQRAGCALNIPECGSVDRVPIHTALRWGWEDLSSDRASRILPLIRITSSPYLDMYMYIGNVDKIKRFNKSTETLQYNYVSVTIDETAYAMA